jgi:hypothetical protein
MARVSLPSPYYYEVLYNLLANDMALYEPYAAAIHEQRRLRAQDSFEVQAQPQRFGMCRSVGGAPDDDEDDVDTLTTTTSIHHPIDDRFAHTTAKAANKFCLSLTFQRLDAQLNVSTPTSSAEPNNLLINGQSISVFVVTGLHGDTDTACMYALTQDVHIAHSARAVCSNVCDTINFARADTPDEMCVSTATRDGGEQDWGDHALAVGMRLQHRPIERAKTITLALAVRNSIVHVSERTFAQAQTNNVWLTRLIDFFTPIDYSVAGYEMPRSICELNVHVQNVAVQYECPTVQLSMNADEAPDSMTVLRLVTHAHDSCNLQITR